MVCPSVFPFHHEGDTSQSARDDFDSYACAPSTDESGPEIVYRVSVNEPAFLSAAVTDGEDVDVDVHLLDALDPSACLDRGDRHARAHVPAGTYYVVADSYVSGSQELAGPYSIDIGLVVPPLGDCTMSSESMERVVGPPLELPVLGPVVKEAHLVTVAEGFGSDWPDTQTEGIEGHYQVSFASTALVIARDEPWCPQESSEYGQGSTGDKVPVLDEAWYITMYWKDRPDGGTRMIVRHPASGHAIVASAGYETGPGDPDHIAGIPEELHFYLGTEHLDELEVGFAASSILPLGPIRCLP